MSWLVWFLLFWFYIGHTYINWRNNIHGGAWFWLAWAISIIPMFPLVVRYSKNLLIDGILFDIIMFLSYILTLLILGSGKAFNLLQWCGLILIVLGVILMKVRI